MKLYNSFLLRCWVFREAGELPNATPEKMIFDIEHIQQGEHHRTSYTRGSPAMDCDYLPEHDQR